MDIIEYESDFGSVYIEVEPINHSLNTDVLRGEEETFLKKGQKRFDQALDVVRSTALNFGNLLEEISPSEATVEFNIKISGEAGMFAVCKVSKEADFKISLSWKNKN